ncbi:hypothetical protein [Bacillus mycoides]|uniref:hypothetical protein n=1 Tax=Bacillus mycoides TaxID=1405 RepID=UPI003A803DB6
MAGVQNKNVDESAKKIAEFKDVRVAAKSILQEYHAMYSGLRSAEAEMKAGGNKEKIAQDIEKAKYQLVVIKNLQKNYGDAKKDVKEVSKGK